MALSPYSEGIAWTTLAKSKSAGAISHALFYIVLWPILMPIILKRPILYEEFEEDVGPVTDGYWVIRLARNREEKRLDWIESRARTGRIMYSLTASFGMQIFASIVAMVILAAASGS